MKKIDFTTSDIDIRERPCDKKQCFFTLKTEKELNEVSVNIGKGSAVTLFIDIESTDLRFIFFGLEFRLGLIIITKQSSLKFKGLHDGELILALSSDDGVLYLIIPLRVKESKNRSFVTEVLEDTVNKFQEQQRVVLYNPISLSDLIPDSPFFMGNASVKMSTENLALVIMDFDNNGYMSISDTAYKKLKQLDTTSNHVLMDTIKETLITGYVTPPRRMTMRNYIEKIGAKSMNSSGLHIGITIAIPISVLILCLVSIRISRPKI